MKNRTDKVKAGRANFGFENNYWIKYIPLWQQILNFHSCKHDTALLSLVLLLLFPLLSLPVNRKAIKKMKKKKKSRHLCYNLLFSISRSLFNHIKQLFLPHHLNSGMTHKTFAFFIVLVLDILIYLYRFFFFFDFSGKKSVVLSQDRKVSHT